MSEAAEAQQAGGTAAMGILVFLRNQIILQNFSCLLSGRLLERF